MDGTRTHDHSDHNRELYQLSYHRHRGPADPSSPGYSFIGASAEATLIALHKPGGRNIVKGTGAMDGTRTHDHSDHNRGLYQLSYHRRSGAAYLPHGTRPVKPCFPCSRKICGYSVRCR